MWKILRYIGFPVKIIELINYYDQAPWKVRVYDELSEPFFIGNGLKQGCVLSALIFNTLIDWIMSGIDIPAMRISEGLSNRS